MDEPAQPVFDEYGYLTPPGPHKGSLCHIRLHFVEGMFPSESRPQLFRVMLGIIRKFINLLHTDCFQVWVGGVFISISRNQNVRKSVLSSPLMPLTMPMNIPAQPSPNSCILKPTLLTWQNAYDRIWDAAFTFF